MSTMNAMNHVVKEDTFTVPTLPAGARYPFTLVRGEGCYVEDSGGKRYLDFYGGHAVCLLGHSHPRWIEAITRQANALAFYSTVSGSPVRARAAELIVERCYASMAKVFFSNSGAEANEAALKIARKLTGRSHVVAMKRGFHGRTLGALSVTDSPKQHAMFPQNLAGKTHFVELGDLKALDRLPAGDIAAVIVEPIQSVGGLWMAEPEYYHGLREYCDRIGAVLIFDEVQTGNGRTGRWFIGEHWDVEPDMVTTAKGVAGGFPAGVTVMNEAVGASVEPADQASTFGGGPLASAAVVATYETLIAETLVEHVAKTSAAVLYQLQSRAGRGLVRDVRGLGYLLGVECERPAREVVHELREAGVLVGASGEPNTFRLLPPLIAGDEEWARFFAALDGIGGGGDTR